MKYFKGFTTLDTFGLKINLRYALGDDIVYILRKFISILKIHKNLRI